ncbi:MAG: hypothetical protein R3E76_03930 [Planctomycetota bacterium]
MNAIAATRDYRIATKDAQPVYELRVSQLKGSDQEFEIYELPSQVSPRIQAPERVGGLHGRNLQAIESRIRKQLKSAGVSPGRLKRGEQFTARLHEDLALLLGLLFRVLAPMRSLDRMREVTLAIEQMNREEMAYWLGMAMHRKKPRRVLAALRMLLTTK